MVGVVRALDEEDDLFFAGRSLRDSSKKTFVPPTADQVMKLFGGVEIPCCPIPDRYGKPCGIELDSYRKCPVHCTVIDQE